MRCVTCLIHTDTTRKIVEKGSCRPFHRSGLSSKGQRSGTADGLTRRIEPRISSRKRWEQKRQAEDSRGSTTRFRKRKQVEERHIIKRFWRGGRKAERVGKCTTGTTDKNHISLDCCQPFWYRSYGTLTGTAQEHGLSTRTHGCESEPRLATIKALLELEARQHLQAKSLPP